MPRISAVIASSTAAAVALASLVIVPAAGAALPSNRDKTIVPGVSIGGVKVGIGARKAVATWGPSDCAQAADILCHYEASPSSANFNTGNTAFELTGGKVTVVSITSAYDFDRARNRVPLFSRALTKYKTADGIGLGASVAQVRRAYPAIRGRTFGGGIAALYTLGRGARATAFDFAASNGRLRLFAIRIGRSGV
ncbi:hypothetical protein Q5424_22925 [Conexibacter sp. JD483]|uniref:hypothetical protein n=1 Tax=unclassified Conexibacter TaxID=2627773 RepID=UPI002724AA90|nr:MULTISPECIES: hypothetical protein [unclassified Conexibacter]MDO8186896.1 hypothetical protein [Conexibacter sp. CPCC 205706]MDO8200792.1 hypothetical protein [Conexibacter sp. CPCC 205762]MDR9371970.1 hypothetical protein [Conexibacter sp. JD483]